jgi:aspartate/methionine/tyrosine aminotransferase
MIADRIINVQKSLIRQIYDSAITGSINLGLGEIQFKTPNHIRLKAKSCINQGELFYTANAGLPELRKLIAEYYNNEKLSINGEEKLFQADLENICVCNGTQEAIFAVLFSLVNPGDEIIIADPTFSAYKTIAEMFGASVKTFDLDLDNDCRVDWNSFDKALNLKTKIVFLNTPSNPLGKSLCEEDIKHFLNKCRQYNLILIVDEVYKDVYLEKPTASLWSYYENTIILSGLSKSHCMTGWRIGWILAKKDFIKPFTIAHQYISTCASVISQKAAISAFGNKGTNSLNSMRKTLKRNNRLAVRLLSECSAIEKIIAPDAAPYLFVKINQNDLDFCKKAAQKGVIVIPGSAFGKNSCGFIRISTALCEKRLKTGLKRLIKTLKEK